MGTVRAELALPLENRGYGSAAVARGVEEAALSLGIAELLDRATGSLSGGELQRVALGATLAGRPSLIVLDEPTSQLDPVAGDELIAVLRRLNEDLDAAILLAEHRLERCLAAADRVIAMRDGSVVVATRRRRSSFGGRLRRRPSWRRRAPGCSPGWSSDLCRESRRRARRSARGTCSATARTESSP